MSSSEVKTPKELPIGCLALLGLLLLLLGIFALSDRLWAAATIFAAGVAALIPGRLADLRARYGIERNFSAGLALCALIVGFVTLGATFEEPPEQRAARERQERVDAEVAANQAKADAEAARVKARDAFLVEYDKVLAAARPCDSATAAAGAAITALAQDGDVVGSYSQAKAARDSCDEAWSTMSAMDAPDGLSDSGEAAVAKAIETCGTAYFIRRRALEGLMTVLDGNTQPSQILAVKEDLEVSRTGPLLCVAEWFTAADKVGVKSDEMKRG